MNIAITALHTDKTDALDRAQQERAAALTPDPVQAEAWYAGLGKRDYRSAAERIEQTSIPEPNSGCWIWIGTINGSGYGKLGYLGTVVTAHRLSWEVHYGAVPTGMCVCHRCDNRLCVNPEHLFLGTNADNVADRVRKGRTVKGPRVTHCKHGHEYTAENTYHTRRGSRLCRACALAAMKIFGQLRRRAAREMRAAAKSTVLP